MILDLTVHTRSSQQPFKVEVQDHALRHLMADAAQAFRVYELMSLRRPGDIWNYMWVKMLDVPKEVLDTCAYLKKEHARLFRPCAWPKRSVPFTAFDTRYCAEVYDISPEAECWQSVRHEKLFRTFCEERFAAVTAAQAALRDSDDVLIQAELARMDARTHSRDFETKPPFTMTDEAYISPTARRHSAEYYQMLREVLHRPEVVCVAIRGDHDYQTLKAACSEQRRRAIQSGNPVGDDMPVCVLSDGVPYMRDWGSRVVTYGEGLGYGDLFVELRRLGASIRDLVEKHGRRSRYFFTASDEGEIQGYTRTTGPGWVLYEDTQTDAATYGRRSAEARQEFMDFLRKFGRE